MTILSVLRQAISIGKQVVLENLDQGAVRTGDTNPFGDKTLLLDKMAEDAVIEVLRESGYSMLVLTEEQGALDLGSNPDFIAIIDPIDGSANLERKIPLCSIGISAAPYSKTATTDDITFSIIDSFFTDEIYIAQRGNGITRNGDPVIVSSPIEMENAIISYDTKRDWNPAFSAGSTRVQEAVHDTRRTASNLLDLCWVASGSLDAMADLRDLLPVVHVCGTHMVQEAGGFVIAKGGKRLCLPLNLEQKMSFIAASNETLAQSILHAFNGE